MNVLLFESNQSIIDSYDHRPNDADRVRHDPQIEETTQKMNVVTDVFEVHNHENYVKTRTNAQLNNQIVSRLPLKRVLRLFGIHLKSRQLSQFGVEIRSYDQGRNSILFSKSLEK